MIQSSPDRSNIVGNICCGGRLVANSINKVRIVEDSAAVHELGVGIVPAIAQYISRADFVGPLVDAFCGVRIVDLMKLPFDSNVVLEIVGRIETITFEFLRTVIRICDVEHRADLQDTVGRCRGARLGMKTSTVRADETNQYKDPRYSEDISGAIYDFSKSKVVHHAHRLSSSCGFYCG